MDARSLLPLTGYQGLPPDETRRRAAELLAELGPRCSVGDFSPDPVPREADLQPWHFVVVTFL